MKRFFASLFSIIALAVSASAVTTTSGTVTVDAASDVRSAREFLQRWDIDWLSDAAGKVRATVNEIGGTVERVVINPDDGATSPTDAYDVTLKDLDEYDVLLGRGANLSRENNSYMLPIVSDGATSAPMAILGDLTLAIDNAGDARGGIIRVYIRR